jgi:hypothetical protein
LLTKLKAGKVTGNGDLHEMNKMKDELATNADFCESDQELTGFSLSCMCSANSASNE